MFSNRNEMGRGLYITGFGQPTHAGKDLACESICLKEY